MWTVRTVLAVYISLSTQDGKIELHTFDETTVSDRLFYQNRALFCHNVLYCECVQSFYLSCTASIPSVVKNGAYKYEDGTRYVGDWNGRGLKHGAGSLALVDGTRYDGAFQNGLCSGLGVIVFPDGAKYEGEFMQGWFHGHGVFWRADGMKYEGEFRGGRVWGLGLVTYADGSHGFPRNEGFFQDCRLVRRRRCPDVIQKAQKIAMMARAQCDA